jgi:4'-phosphopantetheinyl transferase EntD
MTARAKIPLSMAIERLTLPGIVIGHHLISHGDERALMPEEALRFGSSIARVRRASGAARIVARELLFRVGCGTCAIPNEPSGAPIWPSGIVGSLAHDSHVAVAAVALHRDFANIGIDIEPAEPLPAELLNIVATPSEQLSLNADPYGGRLLFVAKEAVYKAVAPLDQVFLDHHDVEVDFANHRAAVRNGRTVDLQFCVSTHLLALAYVRRVRSVH